VRLQSLYADALIVHRLDMATSGLIVFGRGAAVQRALSIAFAERRVAKTYVAVVDGLMNDDAGEIDLPLIADWPNRPRQMVDAVRGKPSRTRWRVLSREAETGRTRVELEPVTGRSHQLRVHLRAIGHPILGDTLYAPPAVAARSQRLLLHASRLQLAHPVDGHALDLRSALPF
jgi:tRNA pseudouridine32 synthase/23S rRNA pseudouridine746 synthase